MLAGLFARLQHPPISGGYTASYFPAQLSLVPFSSTVTHLSGKSVLLAAG